MGRLINIDNGGTLTDICVIEGDAVYRTKTLTTPHDLSRCFVEGLREASRLIYGDADLPGLLRSTDSIRYSTTQGTNAIVEKKGPRIGVILSGEVDRSTLTESDVEGEFFDALVGDRVATLDPDADDLDAAVVAAINSLTSAGANRVVVVHGGADHPQVEAKIRRVTANRFPKHLLGAVPVLYSHEVVDDTDDKRRGWTAVFNAFLHPAMEKFLFNAEHHLRESKFGRPLRIFRNDGLSARVAKTTAIKTYSSGPRGGIEGIRAVAGQYGFGHVISFDVGGTTTDFAELRDDVSRTERYGTIHGIATSFPLSVAESIGVGGSSVIRAVGGEILVGPESVGSAPGPACFGLGGDKATITDAVVVTGLLDPATFFGGKLALDRERAATAIEEHVGGPLGIGVAEAAGAMQRSWVGRIADGITDFAEVNEQSILAAFGGGGPLLACQVADAVGVSRVFIPGLAPVFSAFGLGFSDIGHHYEVGLPDSGDDAVTTALAEVLAVAKRDMFAEGTDLGVCDISAAVLIGDGAQARAVTLDDPLAPVNAGIVADPGEPVRLTVGVSVAAPHPALTGSFDEAGAGEPATAAGVRSLLRDGEIRQAPLYRVADQQGSVTGSGPAVIEDEFFTCQVEPLWRFQINAGGDILLSRG